MFKQATKAQASSDDLAAAISDAMRGMHDLREENASLRAEKDELEHRRSTLESELAWLKAQLDNERTERRHYHSLANEIITRLDIVGRTVDDVVQRAQHEVEAMGKAELKMPEFLNQPIMAYARPPRPKAAEQE
jgi:hypothetical protein